MKNLFTVTVFTLVCFFALTSFSCAPSNKDAAKKLFVYNWTYYIPEDVVKDFEKKANCTVVYDYFSSNEDMFTKLKTGGTGYDVVFPGFDYVDIMVREGMLLPIDAAKVPNLKSLDSSVLARLAKINAEKLYAVPYFMGATGIVVNSAEVQEFEKSWNIYLRADLKRKMTLLDDPRETIGAALKALGYSVNSVNPSELEKAKELLLKWKANILKFDSESFGKGFQQEEFYVTHGYMENVYKELDAARRPTTVGFIPKEGSVAYMDCMVIPQGAKNPELAAEFINFIHTPEVFARIADYLELPSVNADARALTKVPTLYSAEDLSRCELKEDIGENLKLYDAIWQAVRY